MISGCVLRAVALVALSAACSESKAETTSVAPSQSSVGTPCGTTGLPDCPLQGWMKATLKPYLAANDTVRLAASLEQLAEKAPNGFDGWRDSALTAAKAARSGDLVTAKAECKRCHDQHRTRFRSERRAIALF